MGGGGGMDRGRWSFLVLSDDDRIFGFPLSLS